MSENSKDFRLRDMGAKFSKEKLLDFLNSEDDIVSANVVHTPRGNYFTAETPDGMQIWFEEDPDDKNKVMDFNVHYKSSTRMKLILDGWAALRDNGLYGIARMINDTGETEFPLNLDILDAGLFADYEGGEFTVQIAAFGTDVSVFSDKKEFETVETGFAAESFIPVGTFPVGESDGYWEPSAYAMLTGVIKSVRRMVNGYTRGEYYHLLVECVGLKLDVLLDAEKISGEPIAGGYIHGTFYLSARIFPSVGDEHLSPCFSIDIAEIVDSMKNMEFTDGEYDEPTDGWELGVYPIMPDKSVLLVFQNQSEVEEGDEENSTFYYRFLRYDRDGNLTQKRRLRLIGGDLSSAYCDQNDHLHVIFCTYTDDEEYVFDMDDGMEPHLTHSLGNGISRLVTDSCGRIYVGRDYSDYLQGSGELISVYDENGEEIARYLGEGYRCGELLLDEMENLWYTVEPFNYLNKIEIKGSDDFESTKEGFPLCRILGLAISENRGRMLCDCHAYQGRSRYYTLKRNNGKYGSPSPLVFPVLVRENCETYGMSATEKDRILLNVDNVLFSFKLEEDGIDRIKDLRKTRIKRRGDDGGRFYSITIDENEIVSKSELDSYVKPILQNMEDMKGESLTIAYSEARSSDSLIFIQVTKNKEKYHIEIAVDDPEISFPCRVYALEGADLPTTYSTFVTVIADRACPDFSDWTDFTETVFGDRQ